MGFDLNRHWNDPSPWAHPTLCVTKDLVMGYDRDPVSDQFVLPFSTILYVISVTTVPQGFYTVITILYTSFV